MYLLILKKETLPSNYLPLLPSISRNSWLIIKGICTLPHDYNELPCFVHLICVPLLQTLGRMPCHLLFSPQQVIVSSETCWHPEGRGSWSVAFLLPGSVPPAGATQQAEIHYHLPALQSVWPSPRAATLPLFAHQRGLHRRQRTSRSWEDETPVDPTSDPPPRTQAHQSELRTLHGGSQPNKWTPAIWTWCANRGLNINASSLARSRYIFSTGVYLIAASCLILRYSWVLRSDCLVPTCVQVAKSPRKQWVAAPGVDNLIPLCISIQYDTWL